MSEVATPSPSEPELPAGLADALAAAVSALDAQLDGYREFREDPGHFWHYTCIEGARAILDTQKLWFTDILHLNDPMEVLRGIEIFQEICQARLSDAKDDRVRLFLEPMARDFRRAALEPHSFYVASFSKAADDLPQWIAYACQATGCAIEFTKESLQVPANTHGTGAAPMLFFVSYDEVTLRKRLDDLLTVACGAVTAPRGSFEKASISKFLTDLAVATSASALMLVIGYKSERYEHEREVRSLIVRRRTAETALAVRTRVSAGIRIVPFVEHVAALPEGLRRIMLGPRSHELNELGAEELLESRGIAPTLPDGTKRVVRSSIKYRG